MKQKITGADFSEHHRLLPKIQKSVTIHHRLLQNPDDIDSINKMIDEQLETFANRYSEKDVRWFENIQNTIEKTGKVTERQIQILDNMYSKAFDRR